MPFELRLERESLEALWRVVGAPDNDLRLERRKDERDWSMVAQTKRTGRRRRDVRKRDSNAS